jgi:hypothetical protein
MPACSGWRSGDCESAGSTWLSPWSRTYSLPNCRSGLATRSLRNRRFKMARRVG